jgi:hypothetical protein
MKKIGTVLGVIVALVLLVVADYVAQYHYVPVLGVTPHGTHIVGTIDFVPKTLVCGERYVEGDVVNHSAHTYGWVQVKAEMLDERAVRVNDSSDLTSDLEPGRTWHYKMLAGSEAYSSCEVTLKAW